MKVAVVKGGGVGRKLKKFMLSENKDNKNTIFKVIRSFSISNYCRELCRFNFKRLFIYRGSNCTLETFINILRDIVVFLAHRVSNSDNFLQLNQK